MARSISCTVVEVPVMSDSLAVPSMSGFQDLVPWADPYIVQIVRKLQQASCGLVEPEWPDFGPSAEAPPPQLEPAETLLPRTRGTGWPQRG